MTHSPLSPRCWVATLSACSLFHAAALALACTTSSLVTHHSDVADSAHAASLFVHCAVTLGLLLGLTAFVLRSVDDAGNFNVNPWPIAALSSTALAAGIDLAQLISGDR